MTTSVRDERDRASVRGVPGMVVDRDPGVASKQLRVTAVAENAIDVPQQIEGDPLTVRRAIDRHPRTLVGREIDVHRFSAR